MLSITLSLQNDENNKRPHDGSGNEESKKQKTGKSKSVSI